MKNITEILAGVELPDEAKTAIVSAVNENYKTIADYDKQKEKVVTLTADLKTANETLESVNGKLAGLEDDEGKINELQKQFDDYKAEVERQESERKAQSDDAQLTAKIEEALTGKKFVNDYTKAALVAEVKKAHQEDSTKGIADYVKSLTDGKEGIFAPENEPVRTGGAGIVTQDVSTEQARAVMGLPPLTK